MQLAVAPHVADALSRGAPVVALESTIIAHGLPYPANLEVAQALELAVADGGATPATIAIVDGVAHVGLLPDTLERLAADGASFAKAGATDLAVHLARGTSAATTVSATAVLAAGAGIRVFATGGIGGVHRGDGSDVSHDLYALAKTPIAVISAGAKAILDLPRTLELLESLGVLVVGWKTDELPAFYTRGSGLTLEHQATHVDELAAICRVRWDDLAQGGVLVANPIPAAAALDVAAIDLVIAEALVAAEAAGATGKRLTPFLLARIAAATGGAAVAANRALALANAEVGAALAVALATGAAPPR
ncbi:MAG: pseudouridine-5'-phosphate glycosidase [Myxococcales bacterium]|nr:pseudouridine-5'-phosphate glycosidase [Myxococcales bacterium]MBP6844206.1 pseudouridine-5'-phosphate glycosidase [Kofleriaceae bacterium]